MSADTRPRRSAIYVPGANDRAIDRARTMPADVLIFDLEDAVAPDKKTYAREAVGDIVAELADSPHEVVVRVNALDTPWIARDLAAMVSAQPDAVLLPKISRTEDIRRIRSALAAADAPRDLSVWAMIETPSAVIHAAELAAIAAMPTPSITCFVMGTNDLAADLGARIRPGREAIVPHLAHVLAAARAHGLAILDGTFNDIADERGFRRECDQARDMGLDGKTLIHPSQIDVANKALGPSSEDLSWARQVVAAFSAPENAGANVIRIDDRMVERLHERSARRLLDMNDAIAARERAFG